MKTRSAGMVSLMKNQIKTLLAAALLFSFLAGSFAQAQESTTRSGPRRQVATIIFAGLGGAILGLSTLSFYEEPQEHISNISSGFAVGIILGTGYVAYQATVAYNDLSQPHTHYVAQNPAREQSPTPYQFNFEF
jgi:hypothetical protein